MNCSEKEKVIESKKVMYMSMMTTIVLIFIRLQFAKKRQHVKKKIDLCIKIKGCTILTWQALALVGMLAKLCWQRQHNKIIINSKYNDAE